MNKVTIIIPTRNRATLLHRAVSHAFAQDYENLEVIISNNASTDNTREVLKYLQTIFPSLISINHEKLLSLNEHWHRVIEEFAHGDYILIVPDDDILVSRSYITKAVQLFNRYKSVGVVFANYNIVNHKDEKVKEINAQFKEFIDKKFLYENYNSTLFGIKGIGIPLLSAIFKREAYDRVGGFDLNCLSTDTYLWLKILLFYDAGFIEDIVANYMLSIDNMSRNAGLEYFWSDTRIPARVRKLSKQSMVDKRVINNTLARMEWIFYERVYNKIFYFVKNTANINIRGLQYLKYIDIKYFTSSPLLRIIEIYRMLLYIKLFRIFKNQLHLYTKIYTYSIGKKSLFTYFRIADRPKRALLSYITSPFQLPTDKYVTMQFSNRGIAKSIARVLNELDYIIDVVEYTNTRFTPHRHYDLFIGHAGYNWERLVNKLRPSVIKIYFATAIYWKQFNNAEKERFNDIKKRRGVTLPYDRMITHSEEFALTHCDGIIALGNKNVTNSYSKFPHVIVLNNAAYYDTRYECVEKNFDLGRENFLFFASRGNIHKGLDILLESFVQVDSHLYICQHIDPAFNKVYSRELSDFQNIHLVGYTPQRSQKFYELIDQCNYVILPSCAEGQPGSIIECMHQGLIPVVSRESNINVDGFGVQLESCGIEEIVKVIQELSQRTPEWCEEMSEQTRKVAITEYSEEAFLRNMKKAVQEIIAYKSKAMIETNK